MSDTSESETTPTPKEPVQDNIVTTEHSFKLNGKTIKYTATTGTIVISEEDKEKGTVQKASVFFVAYTKNDADPTDRPLTFSFNGGPGSSSVWLHLGLLGPKRVLMDDIGNPLPPPYKLVENEFSLLDETDLVFIDPVSTGLSRAVEGEKAEEFHGFEKDIKSVGEFIRLYLARYERWSSPKFLIGESYGTTRAAGLSGHLQNELGIFLNGLMLISSILDFQTAYFMPNNPLPPILFLPTYSATAWYHGKLDKKHDDLTVLMDDVRAFAEGEYATALILGDKLPDDQRASIIKKLVEFTGLSADYIESTDLKINIHKFVKELCRDERRTVGRLDSRFKGIDRDATGTGHSYDPSYITIQGTYTSCLNDYLARDLGFKTDLPYEILTGKVRPWNYKPFENRYVDVAETLRDAMSRNRDLRVFVANGYYDLATPFFATEYTFNHLGLDKSLHGNITMGYYEAGHMMYVHQESLAQLKQDLSDFFKANNQ